MNFIRCLILCLAGWSTLGLAAEKVVIYNWSEYIPPGLLDRFTRETGIKVVYSTYESNEVMYSKLKLLQAKGYDLVMPSTYYISKMAREGLLRKIDKTRLKHYDNLDPALLGQSFDPDNDYSIPYLWGSTGIGINRADLDPATITGWQDLWDPRWENSLLLTDDVREVFHMALRIKGYSANTRNPKEIETAYEYLKALMPNVLVFNSEAPREPFLSGDVSLGMIWSGSVIMAQEEDKDIRYIYPREGAVFWMDSMAIPRGAANVANAHAFIDYVLRAETGKMISEYIGYSSPNQAAIALMDETLKNNPIMFPSRAVIEAGEFHEDVGDEVIKLYNRYWERLKSGM
jgi:spermidine/putrescine transport system substrate-binding protein